MITRRTLMKSAGAGAAGAAVGATVSARAEDKPMTTKYSGPFEMPKNMTLLSIANGDGTETLGVKTGESVIDVRKAAQLLSLPAALTLDQLLHEGSTGQLQKLVKMAEPRQPVLFSKYNNSLAAANCTIKLPPKELSYKFDYETELLAVIGKKARNVSEADAPNYIAGYCTSNDFSARDLQLETPSVQWMIGKTLDNFAPAGPYFVTSDVVGDPHKLKLQTFVNGEVRQDWSTDDLIFNCYQVVSFISKLWALEPGDIILTGTPHGVILGLPPEKRVWLKAGDQVESRIEKLGSLKFKLA
jgi:2-keto-4-pentenoate hydratase/2-oxohepta-3-ene-1,7-dioic acid hydratase in catechol pathway